MSTYSDISKEIGWDSNRVEYPTLEEVSELRTQAISGDMSAFKKLMHYNRFLPLANDVKNVTITNNIYEAVNSTSHLFKG